MSQAIFQSMLVVFGILFQVLITSFIQPMGFKLNWVLMILIILAFLHGNRLIPFLAIFAGIWCDLMSHGMIGVYSISFLFVILVTQWISTRFYSHTLLLGMIVFFTLSLSLIHISEPTRRYSISYAVFGLKRKTLRFSLTLV